jgi:predicted transcriptional regulator
MSDVSSNIITPPLVSLIVSSYVKKNHVAPSDMPAVVSTVYASLIKLGKDLEPKTTQLSAVSIRQSVRSSYVVCLECGARGKTLRRHLGQAHGLSPAQYRAKWTLPSDHPITAPAYSEERSAFARKIGLGRKAARRRRKFKKDRLIRAGT